MISMKPTCSVSSLQPLFRAKPIHIMARTSKQLTQLKAAASESSKPFDDVTGAMLEPSGINNPWVSPYLVYTGSEPGYVVRLHVILTFSDNHRE